MPLHAKNGCWVFGNAIRRSGTIVLHGVAFWYIDGRIFASREGISSQKKMPPWHLWRGTLSAGQFGPEGRWRETRVDYFPSFFRFTTKSNLKIFGEKIVHWNFFLPKYIKHNIHHGGNSAIISFMPVDNVTACQSWSYCTLSNGHFYSKVTPDIFSTL